MRSLARREESSPAQRNMFSNFFSDIDRMFDDDMFLMPMHMSRMANASMPAANISETEKEYNIELAVPGMKRDDFNIEIDEHMISISCEKEDNFKEDKDNYKRREYNYSSFSRSFRLPETIKADSIKAQYDNGVLHIRVPKAQQTVQKKKRINVD
ncbi:Hsp20/alpha crystallin family protein [Pontibacter sp. BT310]|jgi:HSP20 family protein|uniref:Hsp20/alpha crystallin family protein n=1 Tax=Pontibacter populi TaxID=890055 RepID=A0ABS6XB04_9BACT|nr:MULTISPECIES: Hsp20/alpha crystallin family protein [Pontibacter]MBJ6118332.1 Hsp20/alpha crystallin family protein [Pontibacter sp. BT310]MBR0570759.1 Hsp20/alpha crystallin family protein [Microvirga sp. STS03]MBW3365185.1 Hsp20/alpha crystallin family protein [Pontibacter populi]